MNDADVKCRAYQRGSYLRQSFERCGALNGEQLESLMFPLLGAAWHIHRAAYVHRDRKPDNIYLRRSASIVQCP